MITVSVATRSYLGGRERNEDSVATAHDGSGFCCVLSDGAGGHGGGAIASRIVVDHVIKAFHTRPATDPRDLGELILDAHDAVLKSQREDQGPAAQMHATVVVLMVDEVTRRAIWGHVGDSRLYLLRSGEVKTMTQDDSVVQWMVEAGHLDAESAREHPSKNQLFAALGMHDRIEPKTSNGATELENGDAFLLCSDGWWNGLSDADIAATLAGSRSVETWLDRMTHLIAKRGGHKHDNFSAVGVWVGDCDRTVMGG
jgi:serine/threonine protein phosphatase PrpC